MPMDFRIALALPSDIEVLARLLGAQLEEHGIALERERLFAAIEGALEIPDRGEFLLARLGSEAVGVAYVSFTWSLEHGGKSAWLEELYVIPSQRERGIGTRLLSSVCERASASGCAAVDLEVESDHVRAAHLYERAGFRPHRRARWVLTPTKRIPSSTA